VPLPGLPGGEPLPPRPPARWPEIVTDCYGGDPFKTLVKLGDRYFLIDEAAMIEMFAQNDRAIEMSFRMSFADSMMKLGLPWS